MKKSLTNFDDLLRRAKKYINLEEAQRARKGDGEARSASNQQEKASHPPIREPRGISQYAPGKISDKVVQALEEGARIPPNSERRTF